MSRICSLSNSAHISVVQQCLETCTHFLMNSGRCSGGEGSCRRASLALGTLHDIGTCSLNLSMSVVL